MHLYITDEETKHICKLGRFSHPSAVSSSEIKRGRALWKTHNCGAWICNSFAWDPSSAEVNWCSPLKPLRRWRHEGPTVSFLCEDRSEEGDALALIFLDMLLCHAVHYQCVDCIPKWIRGRGHFVSGELLFVFFFSSRGEGQSIKNGSTSLTSQAAHHYWK